MTTGNSQITCAECGVSFPKPGKGRPPVVCGAECKKIRTDRQHREKYERDKERILERNRKYREPRKEEIAAKVRQKRLERGDEIRERDRERYWEDPEKKRSSRRESYWRHKERFQERNRENYLEKQEIYIADARKYRSENRDKISERRRTLYSLNPGKYNAQSAARRAKILGSFVETVEIDVLLRRDRHTCGICNGPIPKDVEFGDPLYPNIDHIIPLAGGGEHSYQNTQPAHASCNFQKGDKLDGWQSIKPIITEGLNGT